MSETTVRSTCQSRRTPYQSVKVLLDLLASAILIVVLFPILLLIAVAIRVDSRGPAVYRQVRVGADGVPFTLYKFRSMSTDAPCVSTEEMQKMGSNHITRVGMWLRKTSLDELPQLFNIIRGQMSFVGPRPALPSQEVVNRLRAERGADHLRPGITGLAQAMGRDELDDDTKVRYDAQYCQQLSFALDLRVLLLTVRAVTSARGAK